MSRVTRRGGARLKLSDWQALCKENFGRFQGTSEKERMNLNGREEAQVETLNVVSLWKTQEHAEVIQNDPLTDLILEAAIEDEVLETAHVRTARLVNENQFPDQSMYILDEQLMNLRTNLKRIKFYLGELDEIIPR